MTRDEHREKCIDDMVAAYEEETGKRADWIGMLMAFDALHGLARVNPIEATEEMLDIGEKKEGLTSQFYHMSAAGDITNPPEPKP